MDWKKLLLKRPSNTHKFDFGHVFVAGGSPGLTGAVCMAADSALRIGAGVVTVGVADELNCIFEVKLTEAMSYPLGSENGRLGLKSAGSALNFIKRRKVSVLTIGPGLSQSKATGQFVRKMLEGTDIPVVIDADAINVISKKTDILKKCRRPVIMTPHPGEFSRVIGRPVKYINEHRKKIARDFAFRYNLVLVLKGHRTIVTDGKTIYENKTGNPGMATAGCGDILTGIISGLVAQIQKYGNISATHKALFESAKLGVLLHGLAGDLAVKDTSQSFLIARDIIDYLPKAIKKHFK